MDRGWMYYRDPSNRRELTDEFLIGVEEFMRKAMEQPSYISHKLIRCPCMKCNCIKFEQDNDVRLHLYRNGFKPNFWIWTEHGEVRPDELFDLGGPSHSDGVERGQENQFQTWDHMVDDVFRPVLDGDARGINEPVNEEPNPECERFYDILKDDNKPIYKGCKHSTLSLAVALLAAKTTWHVLKHVLIILQKCLQMYHQPNTIFQRAIMKQIS